MRCLSDLSFPEEILEAAPQSYSEMATILHSVASKIGSVSVESYFRAGRAYFTVRHGMGPSGNVFFGKVFEKLLKDARDSPHVTESSGAISVICRI